MSDKLTKTTEKKPWQLRPHERLQRLREEREANNRRARVPDVEYDDGGALISDDPINERNQ